MAKSGFLIALGLIAGVLVSWAWLSRGSGREPRFETPFQAILLDNGQVYYGKISKLGTDYPLIQDVYYIQSATNPETKQVTNILIRRGNEFHGPASTVVSARHVVMVEPVGAGSKVAQLIAEQEKKK